MSNKITLMDGSEQECYPLHFPSIDNQKTQTDELSLDTTGQYLIVGNQPKRVQSDDILSEERNRQKRLFYENVHLFLANAETILTDSRLFLTPVPIVNGLAYTGTSGFQRPTLGIYIEWWLYHKESSVDYYGRPIWYISGSPLSGRNACSSVDRKGKTHRARLCGGFSSVWSTFMKVNGRYTEAKGKYYAYTLPEAVSLLEGKTDHKRILNTHLRLERVRYESHISDLKTQLDNRMKEAREYRDKLAHVLIEKYMDKAVAYYQKYVNLQTSAQIAKEYFRERRVELRKQLREGKIDNVTYQKTISPLNKRAKRLRYELFAFDCDGLQEAFGEDAKYFTFHTVESILCERNKNKEDVETH